MKNIEITQEAEKYIKTHGNRVMILLNEKTCCGGNRLSLPSVLTAAPSSDSLDKYIKTDYDNITVYIPKDIRVRENLNLKIQLESFLMIKKLTVEGIETASAGCSGS